MDSKSTKVYFSERVGIDDPNYQLFLVKFFSIEKNEVLNKYVLNETVYDTLDSVLAEANKLYRIIHENKKNTEIERRKANALSLENEAKEALENQRIIEISESKRKESTLRRIKHVGLFTILVLGLILLYLKLYQEHSSIRAATAIVDKHNNELSDWQNEIIKNSKINNDNLQIEIKEAYAAGNFFNIKVGEKNLVKLSHLIKGIDTYLHSSSKKIILSCFDSECATLLSNGNASNEFRSVIKSVRFSYCISNESFHNSLYLPEQYILTSVYLNFSNKEDLNSIETNVAVSVLLSAQNVHSSNVRNISFNDFGVGSVWTIPRYTAIDQCDI
jgi:hypothetical protein